MKNEKRDLSHGYRDISSAFEANSPSVEANFRLNCFIRSTAAMHGDIPELLPEVMFAQRPLRQFGADDKVGRVESDHRAK